MPDCKRYSFLRSFHPSFRSLSNPGVSEEQSSKGLRAAGLVSEADPRVTPVIYQCPLPRGLI